MKKFFTTKRNFTEALITCFNIMSDIFYMRKRITIHNHGREIVDLSKFHKPKQKSVKIVESI